MYRRESALRWIALVGAFTLVLGCRSSGTRNTGGPLVVPAEDGFFVFDSEGIHYTHSGVEEGIEVRSAPVQLGRPSIASYDSDGDIAIVAYPEHLVRLDRERESASSNDHFLGGAPEAVTVTKDQVAVVLATKLRVYASETLEIVLDLDLAPWLERYGSPRLRQALLLKPDEVDEVMLVCEGEEPIVLHAKLITRPGEQPSVSWVHEAKFRARLVACTQDGVDTYLAGQYTKPVPRENEDGESEDVDVDFLRVMEWPGAEWGQRNVLDDEWPFEASRIRQLAVDQGLILLISEADELVVYRGKKLVKRLPGVRSAAILSRDSLVVHDGTEATKVSLTGL